MVNIIEENPQVKIKALEQQLTSIQKKLNGLEDVEAIQKLTRAYGYFFEQGMAEEIADLFVDDGELCTLGMGTYVGKKKILGFFKYTCGEAPSPEFLHLVIQISPIIDVAPDGQTAQGRWYAYGAGAIPKGQAMLHMLGFFRYENKYVKKNGVWMFQRIETSISAMWKPSPGFADQKKVDAFDPVRDAGAPYPVDIPDDTPAIYPSGWRHPYHFKHPVTGKPIDVSAWNEKMKKQWAAAHPMPPPSQYKRT
jgi:hypothetical protein